MTTRSERLSRRSLLACAAIAGCGAAALLTRAAAAEDKIKKQEALYQNTPKGQQRCEICLQFEAPNRCKIVDGDIVPKGWCQFFAARENAH
jgi:hypothetical protein